MTSLIQLRGIELTFAGPPRTEVLKPITLDIEHNGCVAVVGPSGAGKSSLASILGVLQPPTAGTYTYSGQDVTTLSRREAARFRRSTIGFVFQAAHLIDERSAWANVALGLSGAGLSGSLVEDKAREALRRVGLREVADRTSGLLSGGERQRVAVARAIVKSPELIIADEPTAALDQSNGRAILELLIELTVSNGTLIVVSHDSRAAELASDVVTMMDGRVVG